MKITFNKKVYDYYTFFRINKKINASIYEIEYFNQDNATLIKSNIDIDYTISNTSLKHIQILLITHTNLALDTRYAILGGSIYLEYNQGSYKLIKH